ncbi:MAG: M28 family peptidase [Deltaproteobacteria bacterium]|nr:M28 family peptidase [Deltaproteobacteria bacterium]
MKSLCRNFRVPITAAAVLLSVTALLALSGWTFELPTLADRSEALLRHARYLASDELAGRGVDNPGIDLARDYIAAEFKKYGLTPGGQNGGFFQSLEVVVGVTIKQPSSLTLAGGPTLALHEEWIPFGLSRSGSVEAEVVFAGYGITAKDYGYDDYAGLDVKDKIVLVLRYEPPPKDEKSPFRKAPRYSSHASLVSKANNARAHGAVGMILVDLDQPRSGEKGLIPTRRTLGRTDAEIVATQVKGEVAERRLEEAGVSLRELKERIDREEKPASTSLPGLRASLNVTLEKITKKTDNVIGVLPGSDPELKKENVVIGAHYDHIGLGYFGTRDTKAEGQIHNGADDNASGTAVLMNLAERLGARASRPARTIVFIAFTAEELGVLGSAHYVGHPLFPLASTKAMINLDMVGRMKDNRLTVAGVDTAKEFRPLVTQAGQEFGVEINLSSRAAGGSDHTPFYRKDIPVLHFYTGTHEDYHRPTDDWQKLNLQGMAKVSDVVLSVAERLAMSKEPPAFVHTPAGEPRS